MFKITLFCFLLFFVSSLNAVKLTSFTDILNPICIAVDEKNLYVSEQKSIFVYSLNDFKLIRKFGKEGEGPGEFRLNPVVKVRKNGIFIHTFIKFCLFSKDGKLINEKRISLDMLSNIDVLGNYYVMQKGTFKEKPQFLTEICIYNQDLKKIKTLYQGKGKRLEKQKLRIRLINPTVKFQCWSNKIFIANCNKGFFIEAFDINGNSLYSIKKKLKKIRISESYKIKRKEDFLKKFTVSQRSSPVFKKIVFEFPDYFPPIQDFIIKDNKMYVKTYGMEKGKEEYLVLDLMGVFLKKLYLPKVKTSFSTFKNNKFYYLMENEDTEEWEFNCIIIK